MSELVLRYWVFLLGTDAALVVAHLVAGKRPFWNLDREHNLPSWFSGAQLLLLAVAALDVADRERRMAMRAAPGPGAWRIIGLAFLYLSLDEVTVLHESYLREEIRGLFGPGSVWVSVLPWQIVLGPFLAAFAALLLVVFATRFAADRGLWRPAAGGLCCWVGAVLTEGLAKPLFIRLGAYQNQVAVEEGLELLGATLLLLAVTRYGRSLAAGTASLAAADAVRRWLARAGAAGLVVLVAGAGLVAAFSLANADWLLRYEASRLARKGECAAAVPMFQAALRRRPDDAQAWLGLARCQSRLRQPSAALASADKGLERAPTDAQLWNLKGSSLYRLDRFEEAEAAYRSALRLRPRYAIAQANLGLVLERLGRKGEASKAYAEALAIDPANALARRRTELRGSGADPLDDEALRRESREPGKPQAEFDRGEPAR
jgi:tetratricopeptide (TPR) repeat protein